MVIYLPGEHPTEQTGGIDNLTPREIVGELDKYVVGQHNAKRAVAIALRNRIRRQMLPEEMAEEVAPKNIIMIGPTGVGKTEIARRLAKLANSPFLKIEASKFTEVGYVGRDVESMVRDLTEIAVSMVRKEERKEIADKARKNAEEKILDSLLPAAKSAQPGPEGPSKTREKLRQQLLKGALDDKMIEINVQSQVFPHLEIVSNQGIEEMDVNLKDMFGSLFKGRQKKTRMKVSEAMKYLCQEEEGKLVDMEKVARLARTRVEQTGIIFLDEIDKIVGRESGHGPDVSREGVQRDILPIVEGTSVNTKYGIVRTDHVLFIAAGAFHVSKPSDLIPELQGRFPIRVELKPLGQDEFVRILTEPKNALMKQYSALLKTEDIELSFTDDAVSEISRLAVVVNEQTENIGARRLHTVMEKLLDNLSFEGPDLKEKTVTVDAAYVREMLADVVEDQDLSRYIL